MEARRLKDVSNSFFVSNLPEDGSPATMWKTFESVGKLADLYVARKRAVGGSRFGFARYLKSEAVGKIVTDLNNLTIGDRKIIANVARYNRGGKQQHLNRERVASEVWTARPRSSKAVKGKSYADVVANKHPAAVKLSSTPGMASWRSKNLVGVSKSYTGLKNLASLMEAEGCDIQRLHYLGGFSVLLEFKSVEEAKDFLFDKKCLWENWFSSLDLWSEAAAPKRRFASIYIFGVPAHAWCTEAFSGIAKSVGDVMMEDPCDDVSMNLAVGKVVICTDRVKLINTVMKVDIDGRSFDVRISEDVFESVKLLPTYPAGDVSYCSNSEFGSVDQSDKDIGFYEPNHYDDGLLIGGSDGPNGVLQIPSSDPNSPAGSPVIALPNSGSALPLCLYSVEEHKKVGSTLSEDGAVDSKHALNNSESTQPIIETQGEYSRHAPYKGENLFINTAHTNGHIEMQEVSTNVLVEGSIAVNLQEDSMIDELMVDPPLFFNEKKY